MIPVEGAGGAVLNAMTYAAYRQIEIQEVSEVPLSHGSKSTHTVDVLATVCGPMRMSRAFNHSTSIGSSANFAGDLLSSKMTLKSTGPCLIEVTNEVGLYCWSTCLSFESLPCGIDAECVTATGEVSTDPDNCHEYVILSPLLYSTLLYSTLLYSTLIYSNLI